MRIFKHHQRSNAHRRHRRARHADSGIATTCRDELSIIADHRQGTSEITASYLRAKARTYSL